MDSTSPALRQPPRSRERVAIEKAQAALEHCRVALRSLPAANVREQKIHSAAERQISAALADIAALVPDAGGER